MRFAPPAATVARDIGTRHSRPLQRTAEHNAFREVARVARHFARRRSKLCARSNRFVITYSQISLVIAKMTKLLIRVCDDT